MAGRKLFESASDGERDDAPLGGTRAEAIQRLQVGLFGLFSMVLVVGVANIVYNRAQVTEDASVPEAAPTTEPTEAPPQRDPLADAGVVPDIPTEAEAEAETEPNVDLEESTVPDVPAADERVVEDVPIDPQLPSAVGRFRGVGSGSRC